MLLDRGRAAAVHREPVKAVLAGKLNISIFGGGGEALNF